MNRVVVLGAGEALMKFRKECERVGIPLPRAGCVLPGPKRVLLVDVESFQRLVRVVGPLRLSLAADWLLVVGGPETNNEQLARIAAADGVFLSSGEPDLLPLVLRRIMGRLEPPSLNTRQLVRPPGTPRGATRLPSTNETGLPLAA